MEIEPNASKYPDKKERQFKISFNTWDNHQVMNCPICNCEFTHITEVSTFSRKEDEKIHLETNINLKDKKINTNVVEGHGNNPSGRRNGLILHGHCEEGCKFDIEMYQHKGNTFFNSFFKGVLEEFQEESYETK